MVVKEFIQMRRDRLTFNMMVGIPLVQLILFGYAINSNPQHLPAAVLLADDGREVRTLLSAIKNTGYFDFVKQVKTEKEAHDALALNLEVHIVDGDDIALPGGYCPQAGRYAKSLTGRGEGQSSAGPCPLSRYPGEHDFAPPCLGPCQVGRFRAVSMISRDAMLT